MEQSFPFGVDYMTWESWNGNFIQWFGEQPIPFNEEINWRETAAVIASLPQFAPYPLPMPDIFVNWQDWASEVTNILNGPVLTQGKIQQFRVLVYIGL